RERLAGINPKAVAATAACVLVLSLGGILLAETVIGKPISSALGKGDDHGGNSLTRLTGGGVPAGGERTTSPSSTATVTSTAPSEQGQTNQPTTTAPTREPTSAPTTSRPVVPPTTRKPMPTTSTPATTKSEGTSTVGSTTDVDRQKVPGE